MRSQVLAILIVVPLSGAGPGPSRANWVFMPPNATGGEAALAFVDGGSFHDVWAVGAWQPTGWAPLIEHFDGAAWTQLPTPSTDGGRLLGVVAISPDRAIAVGTHTPAGTTPQPLAMEWNGSEWELVPTPEQQGGRVFEAVDHTSTGATWVAGHEHGRAFLARRNGGSWDMEFAPEVGSFRNRFYAMHARSDTEIWVVGTQSDGFGEFKILLQRYDGSSSWTTFDVPSPSTLDEMKDVLAFASDDAWAVGFYYHVPLYLYQPLVLHYDGTTWTPFALPELPEGSARLEGIAANAPDDIYAAGTYATANGTPRPYMLHYDGVSWTEVLLPPTGGSSEWFLGMTATGDGALWAVGQYFDGTTTEPMSFLQAQSSTAVQALPSAQAMSLRSVPNPFRSTTTVHFSLAHPGPVELRVWEASGRLVRTLVHGELQAGPHVVSWDGRDSFGRVVGAGVYFARIDAGAARAGRSLVIVR